MHKLNIKIQIEEILQSIGGIRAKFGEIRYRINWINGQKPSTCDVMGIFEVSRKRRNWSILLFH